MKSLDPALVLVLGAAPHRIAAAELLYTEHLEELRHNEDTP